MNGVLTGVVMSTQLGHFGSQATLYGFVTVEADDGSLVQVKIDAYTEHDPFDIGDRVELEVAPLGQTKILVVKRIHKIVSGMEQEDVGSAAELAPA